MKNTLLMSALGLSMAVATPALADPTLEFDDIGGQTGTISYDGNGGALVGSGIVFDQFRAIDTPQNAGDYTCVDCTLNFSTGALQGSLGQTYSFSGGGSLTLTGSVVDGSTQIAAGTLATGEFTSAVFLEGDEVNGAAFEGLGLDTKNEALTSFFALGPDFSFADTQIATTAVDAEAGFSVGVTNADFTNEPLAEVPEPGTLGLLGAGLVGLGFAARRRRKA